MAAFVSAVDSPVSPNISALPAIVSLTIKLDMQIKLDAWSAPRFSTRCYESTGVVGLGLLSGMGVCCCGLSAAKTGACKVFCVTLALK